MSHLDLPVLDLQDLLHGDRAAFVASLHEALQRWGFVAVTGHGIPTALLDQAYAAAAGFFALPRAAKQAYELPAIGRQRGYTGFGVEHAKDQDVHDLKEFWQIGHDLGPQHPLVASGTLPDNVWPSERPDFQAAFAPLFAALDTFANHLLGAIGEGVGLDPHTLVEAVREGNSVQRVIHYPPLRPSDPRDAARAAAHEDINLLTVLPASTQPGLELLDRDGTWRSIITPPDVMVCDTGDIFQRLTGGLLPATTHRVVNPPGGANVARYSMPFFVHPRPSWVIQPIQGDEAPITAGDFLAQRLREIRLL